ncbi:Catechol 2,3-dioxygenase [Halobacillus karajensis]|uniref:Cadmium-induced protein CadI n=1 Tax=Halobacillus karajensis TaxID=195088 RepID=A0A024P6S4_9BACI|nr:Cadmium-induced protein CadI [Halobacillus karajensis]CDQ24570.1 Cadmium-induced protein CadI [Halobacillus karajensis]CDQ29183.1 Cadmium-induced protein CadI [Halobacillus karajensis]SEH57003.1 Catechol 2,3-dioxygenase [Halobacillus karajensis]
MNVHVGLNVVDMEKSIKFYNKVFEEKPVKQKSDYAKYLPKGLQLNFTLNVTPEVSGNQVGHFGIQVEKQEDIDEHKQRLEKLGFFTREEKDTNCCYAFQDKFWITDPDGNEWEFFYTKKDVEGN